MDAKSFLLAAGKAVLNWLFTLLWVVAVVAVIRTFVFSPFVVEGRSMEPTFQDANLVAVDKISAHFQHFRRGDAVVFASPTGASVRVGGTRCLLKKAVSALPFAADQSDCIENEHLIKRVVGLPGDTIILRDGDVFWKSPDGQEIAISQDFLLPENRGSTCLPSSCASKSSRNATRTFDVPEGAVFVLGDNRMRSSDSRAWRVNGEVAPFVPFENIAGVVRFRFAPLLSVGPIFRIPLLPELPPIPPTADVPAA